MAPLPTPRVGCAVITGPDGLLYVIGGTDDMLSGGMATVEAYSIATNTWATLPALSQARAELSAAVGSDGLIYAMGGWQSGSTQAPMSTVESYAPGGDAGWQLTTPLPEPRHSFAAATGPDGRIYILGGTGLVGLSTELEAYSVDAGWTGVNDGMTPRLGLGAAFGPDGNLYALGGLVNSAPSNLVEAWTPGDGGSWSTRASMTVTRAFFGAARAGDRIYALSGDATTPVSFTATAEAFTAGPDGGSWANAASFPVGEYALGATTGPDGRVYALGGLTDLGYETVTYAYSPTLGAW